MPSLNDVVMVSGVRTATGSFLGSLKDVKAYDMGAACVKELMARTGLPGQVIDEVIFGNQFQAGNNANPARWAAICGGLPDTVPAFTPMKNCGTALKAVILGAQSIQTGDNDTVLVGGMGKHEPLPLLPAGRTPGLSDGTRPHGPGRPF